ncbi:MAG: GntR family transcriptional regulator [Hyphomicrobiales bacterium]
MEAVIVAAESKKARSRAGNGRTQPQRSKGSVQDQVYSELRRALMIGRFLPGQGTTLRALAADLGVSLMPVRAALPYLIAEGGFEMLPNRSVRVPLMTSERLEELIAVRVELEGLATAQACRRMTEAELAALDKIHRRTMRLIDEHRPADILVANQSFHFTLYGFARSWILMPMIETLWLRAGPFINLAQKSPGIQFDGRHHVDLMHALARRDAAAARRAVERDIAMAGQNLRKTRIFSTPRQAAQ